MNLTLKRNAYRAAGIFGDLYDENGNHIAISLEHAYPDPSDYLVWKAKIPLGTFRCVRGMHRLNGMIEDFETFEVTGVPGHTGILIHPGNVNADSSGCILVGNSLHGDVIGNSRVTFWKFLEIQSGVDSFQLTVV